MESPQQKDADCPDNRIYPDCRGYTGLTFDLIIDSTMMNRRSNPLILSYMSYFTVSLLTTARRPTMSYLVLEIGPLVIASSAPLHLPPPRSYCSTLHYVTTIPPVATRLSARPRYTRSSSSVLLGIVGRTFELVVARFEGGSSRGW